MAGLDEVLIHINYAREDLKEQKVAISDMRKEIREDNKLQWVAIGANRSSISKQTGRNSVYAVIAAAVTTALVELGFRK